MQLPLAWSEFGDTRCGMLAYALQDVDQVGVDVNVMEPAGHDEALHDTDVFRAEFCPTKIPVFSRMEGFPYALVSKACGYVRRSANDLSKS